MDIFEDSKARQGLGTKIQFKCKNDLCSSQKFEHAFFTTSKKAGQNKFDIKGVGGGKISSPSISFIFTYVIDLPFLVSKSAHLSPNSRWFRFYGHLKVGRRSEKYSDLTKT